MGYLLAFQRDVYRLVTFQVIPAKMTGKRVTFDNDERDRFTDWLLWRRDRWLESMDTATPPEPFRYNAAWECKNCSALILCEGFKAAGRFIPHPGNEPSLPDSLVEVS